MNLKYFDLTKDEQELLTSFENGEWRSISELNKAKKIYQKAAKSTLEKTKNINLRLTERTVVKLKAKAISEGIPYQTLASSVLHKYVNQ